jgi:hypothetical protein
MLSRISIKGALDPNFILPVNCWIRPFTGGYPNAGLTSTFTYTGISNGKVPYLAPEGDFMWWM